MLLQYNKFVKPSLDNYVRHQIHAADIVVPRGVENTVAIGMIVGYISRALSAKSDAHRQTLLTLRKSNGPLDAIPANVTTLPQTHQIRGMHTIIRNKTTERGDFIFYMERLAGVIIERAVEQLPCHGKTVLTSSGYKYKGTATSTTVSGVSIMRAGECFENALRRVFRDCTIGKILIQSDSITGEPHLHYQKLPKNLRDGYIVLMDAQIASGAASIMAIRVLLDHQVPEDRIILVAYLGSSVGLKAVGSVYPNVKVVVSAIDKKIGISNFIVPGIGPPGDRYFGC